MLAVIIPYYKFTFFEATLQSLANQTDKRFKVYIGDDASPEDCNYLISEFKGYFDFTYHRFETNLGGISLTQQWERCIALSNNEEWLMILGDDDVLGENVVEEFYKQNQKNINVFRFSTIVIDENNEAISDKFNHPALEKASTSFFRKLNNETRSSLSEYIFKRTLYQQYKFSNYPLAWYSDDMAWIKFSNSTPIVSINEAVIYFRYSDENISGKKDNIQLKKQAKFLFFQQILTEELIHFSPKQILRLLIAYEVLLRNLNLLNFSNIVFLTYQYVKIGKLYCLLRFFKRQFIKTIKRERK